MPHSVFLFRSIPRRRVFLGIAANSIGRCNSFREYIGRCPIAECLARPRIELARNRIQLRLGIAGEVGPLRQILAQQAIGVLVGPALGIVRLRAPVAKWADEQSGAELSWLPIPFRNH